MLSRFLNKALTLLDLGDKLSFVGIKKFTSQTPLGDQYYPWVLYAAPLFAFLSIPVIIKSDIESIPVEGSIVNKLSDFEEVEEAAKPVVPKKPLTESDLLSGFMSAFGSNI